ncbi:TonB-dependent receptor [Cryomorphaceae bacterium]|nr:TonB-dependent receptor [Cryomorphaceae bacterium]
MKYTLSFIFALVAFAVGAQNAVIRGQVVDAKNNEPLPFANVIAQGTQFGTTTDIDGNFELRVDAGLYNLEISFIGYRTKIEPEIQASPASPAQITVKLDEDATQLAEVEVVANPFEKDAESPVSVQNLGVNEIRRSPGGNQDISRVIQNLPGVASTVSFRNDLIVRGGAPNENRFYLDGIEIPSINHFSTQGGGGGPVGIINVNFLEGVDFYTGAFPVNRGYALSSVMDLRFKDPRMDGWGFKGQIGASDIGLTAEGPLGDRTGMILSVRRSYLQFLFSLLELPFLPTYNDFTLKVKHKINDRSEITVLGIGAIDNFDLNLDANETESQQYILNNLPVNEQWNYSTGIKYTLYGENGYQNFVLSRYHLNNTAVKYEGNDESSDDNLILDYESQEIENKFRYENISRYGNQRIVYGVNLEHARYKNSTFNRTVANGEPITVDFNSQLDLWKYGLFGNYSFDPLPRLTVSAGFRIDGSDYNDETSNPFSQFSPRLSLSYGITDKLSFNFNTGIFYQLPPYTVLGYRDNDEVLVNQENGIGYVQSNHLVAGVSYLLPFNSKVSVEGFYKTYDNYPLLTRDSISLANLGSDFGIIGNEPAIPTSDGRSYGIEILYQQKLFKGFYGIVSYTFVLSEFTNGGSEFVPSSWDNRNLVSLTGGKKWGNNWEAGFRWRFLGGAPYTPFDLETTALKDVWDVTGQGVPDYDQINTLRNGNFNQLDVRIDKKWFFETWNLNLYFDVENVLGFTLEQQPFVDVVRDGNGNPVTDPNDPSRYLLKELENTTGTTLPTIGVIIDF